MCRGSKGFWDNPVSEQSLLICTVPSVDTETERTVDGPKRVSWSTKAFYSACVGSDPIVAWLDMGPTSPRRVARSQLPYNAATAVQSTAKCKALANAQKPGLDFMVRLYNSSTATVDNRMMDDGYLSIFMLPANDVKLIKQAIYSAGTISAAFSVYDGGSRFVASFLSPLRRSRPALFYASGGSLYWLADFFAYKSGVYTRQDLTTDGTSGRHVVAVIGYGWDNGTQYWIFANSWGTVISGLLSATVLSRAQRQGTCCLLCDSVRSKALTCL
jgi:hypothetical protein